MGAKAAGGKQAYTQVYNIINEAASIVMGKSAPKVQDSASLVGLGSKILSNDALSINFVGTLFARIGKTIIENRAYRSSLSFLMYSDFEWGGIVNIIETEMPEAVADASLDLEEGKSVDMYIVAKPKAKMKFYWKKSLYTFFLTIQRKFLKDAFTGAGQMGSFLSSLEQQVKNKLELSNENQGQLTLGNMAGVLYDTPMEIKLISDYAKDTGLTANPSTCLSDPRFLRYYSMRTRDMAIQLRSLNTLWNMEHNPRFTNPDMLRFVLPSQVLTAMETNVEYDAFHEDKVAFGKNVTVPHWQSARPNDRLGIKVRVDKNMDDANPDYQNVEIENLVGIMFDKRAAGTFRTNHEVATTPYNARGRYTNTFWHEDNMWFNNLGEQAVIFTLR